MVKIKVPDALFGKKVLSIPRSLDLETIEYITPTTPGSYYIAKIQTKNRFEYFETRCLTLEECKSHVEKKIKHAFKKSDTKKTIPEVLKRLDIIECYLNAIMDAMQLPD